MRSVRLASLFFILGAALLFSATLEKFTLDELIGKSTDIVRASVTGSHTTTRGALIYTHYRIRIASRWKGKPSGELEFVIPGGTAGGFTQVFSGAPKLEFGRDYVLFLWTGSSGLTHVLGWSQGVFDVVEDTEGKLIVKRAATNDVLLDSKTGQTVKDEPVEMKLPDLEQRITAVLGGVGKP